MVGGVDGLLVGGVGGLIYLSIDSQKTHQFSKKNNQSTRLS